MQNLDFQKNLILNTELALEKLDNNQVLYDKLLQNFYKQYLDLDFLYFTKKELEAKLHILAGLCSYIGAEILEELAIIAKKTMSDKDIAKLNKELRKTLEFIKDYFL